MNESAYGRCKILVIVESAESGGGFDYAARLLRYLVKKAMGPVLVACTNRRAELALAEVAANLIFIQLPFLDWERRPWRYFRNPVAYWWEAYQVNKTLARKGVRELPVLVSVCSPGRFLHVKGSGKRNMVFHTYPRGWKHLLIGGYFGLILRKWHKVVAVSEYLRSELIRVWMLDTVSARVVVIKNTAGEVVQRGHARNSRALRILSVGAVASHKSPDTFIDIAETCHDRGVDAEFVWVGDGPLLEKCRSRIKQLGLESVVSFCGFLNEPDIEYSRAHVYLQLSSVDSMPLALLDAAKRGLPSIVADRGGLPEVLGPALSDWVVVHGDHLRAAALIEELLSSEVRETFSKALLNRYQEQFSEGVWCSAMAKEIAT